jgi:Mn2+/Fe2+ NRAMP family transporter
MLSMANIATIAADLSGVAAVLGMLTGIRWEIFVPPILLALGLVLHSGYGKVKQVLTALTFVLLSYVGAVLMARPDWAAVIWATLLPQIALSPAWLVAALGLLGTAISPYMLFWQANEEAEELHDGTSIQASQENASVWLGMIYSNLISLLGELDRRGDDRRFPGSDIRGIVEQLTAPAHPRVRIGLVSSTSAPS